MAPPVEYRTVTRDAGGHPLHDIGWLCLIQSGLVFFHVWSVSMGSDSQAGFPVTLDSGNAFVPVAGGMRGKPSNSGRPGEVLSLSIEV